VAAVVVFALIGVMLVTAATTSQGTDLRAQRNVALRDLVREASATVRALDAQVTEAQARVDALAAAAAGPMPASTQARRAGLEPMSGRGVRVLLDDAPPRDPDDPLWATLSADDVIVHQADVQAVINALWRGGARGIQVMDQRLVATSAVQCVGNTLLLQGQVYSPPYVITAVGPPRGLRAALAADPQVAAYRSWAEVVGLGYEEERVDDVELPAYTGPVSTAYARPSQ
jgi:uncharacterized protein YlxW (UPF0749 family)